MNAIASGILIAAGLLVPGLGWAVGARWPAPGLAAGALSALAIFAGVTLCTVAGIPLTLGVLAGWLAAVALAGAAFWWPRRQTNRSESSSGQGHWWLALPAAPMVLVAVWRATQQPLSGLDADLRWNYLAELLVQRQNLDFYPPLFTDDFAVYFWADGIAPLVSGLYAWTYLAAGSLDRHWTAIPVLLQLIGLVGVLHGLGRSWGGKNGGWLACALGGCTFILQFAFNIGQETGLTGLGAAGMVFYLTHWHQTKEDSLLIPAAACAAIAACAREYGIAFPFAGIAWVLFARRDLRPVLSFALLALVVPGLWYLRSYWRTGNPVYSLNLAGLFPVNPVFDARMQSYAADLAAPLHRADAWWEILRYLWIGTLPATLGLLLGAGFFFRQAAWRGAALVAAAAVLCWLASMRFTASGLFFSMRVLSPFLIVGCASGGAALAVWLRERRPHPAIIVALTIFGLDASARALTVPVNPYRIPLQEWPRAGYSIQDEFDKFSRPFLRTVIAQTGGKILSDAAVTQGVFHQAGRNLAPIWSPEVEFLFNPGGSPDAADRLLALGYTHLLLTKVQSNFDFLIRSGAWGRLDGRLKIVLADDTFVLYALTPAPPATK